MKNANLKKLSFAALAGLFAVGAGMPLQAQTPTPSGGAGSRPVAILACQYPDKPNTYGFMPSDLLAQWMTNTLTVNGATVDNSISGLVSEASGGTVDFKGSQAFGWYTLPNPSTVYAANFAALPQPADPSAAGIAIGTDCLAAAQKAGVNLAQFTYVAMYLNDDMPGAAGVSWPTNVTAPSPTTLNTLIVFYAGLVSPPLVLHELGHILSTDGFHTDSGSDPLGSASWYGQLAAPSVPTSVAPGWDASRRELMGFIPMVTTYSGGTQIYNLSRLTQPYAGLASAIDVPLPNGAKYVVSARTHIGHDALDIYTKANQWNWDGGPSLPNEGVEIELYTSTKVNAHVETSAPIQTPFDIGTVWLTGQTYTDSANGITIGVLNFNATANPTAQIVVSSGPKPAVVQLNSGGGAAGSFAADADFTGGIAASVTSTIDTSAVTNPAPQAVYQSERYGNITYTIPNLTAGAPYKVRLHFAEIFWTAAGQRTFNVSINGNQVLTNFDIFATAGAQNKAVVEEFATTANAQGQIVIAYTTVVDNAKSSGIEIVPL